MTHWCILIATPATTLKLAETLREDGYEAWTPSIIARQRSRDGRKPEPVVKPLLVPYVFAHADRLIDLVTLSRSPSMLYQAWDAAQRRMVTKGHPYFRVFKQLGEYYHLRDKLLDPLRAMEHKTKPKGEPPAFNIGDQVRIVDRGGLDGMTGRVEAIDRKHASVRFTGWPLPLTIPLWTLLPALDTSVHGGQGENEQAMLAKVA